MLKLTLYILQRQLRCKDCHQLVEKMKRISPQFLSPDHPMYTDAVDAMKRFREAQATGKAAEEVERLRLIAEAQFQAVTDYQLQGLNGVIMKRN